VCNAVAPVIKLLSDAWRPHDDVSLDRPPEFLTDQAGAAAASTSLLTLFLSHHTDMSGQEFNAAAS
jgi:hypothetical protein